MAEHTPGPWQWNADFYDVRNSKDDCSIAVVLLTPDEDEAQANGRLIAGAPELLEALVALTDYTAGEAMFQRGANGPWQIEDEQLGHLIEASRDAIDKAEGREP